MDARDSIESAYADLASRVSRLEVPLRKAKASTAFDDAVYTWRGEVLDVGGTAGAVLPASSSDWDSYFDNPTVTKYKFEVPTTSGDFFGTPQRGLEGEYRWSMSFESSTVSEVPALITYYTDSVGASIQLKLNGVIVHNADFAGSTIIGVPITLRVQRGPNRLTLATNIYVDECALYTGAFLTKGFTKPL